MNAPLQRLRQSVHPVEPLRTTNARTESVTEFAPFEFRILYERWFDDVFRWVRRLGGPQAECEDLVQDVFIVVHRRLPFFDGENLAGWLFQIARRRVRNFLRLRWVKHILFGGEPLPESLGAGGASPAQSAESNEKRVLLERLLSKLNAAEREALMLFELDGYSGAQIAQMQGVTINTVWARMRSARRKLTSLLAKHESRTGAVRLP